MFVDEFIHTFAGERTLSLLRCMAVANGNSVREIASALDMASTTVFRRLKKAKENNITIPADTPDPVPSVPPVPLAEQVEHPEQRLPFSEEDRV